MAVIIAAASAPGHLQRIENLPSCVAKPDLKKIEIAWREHVGSAVQRALSLANLSQKEASGLLGHPDAAQLNRWIKGKERPQFDALFAVDVLRQPLVVALAELAGAGVEIETVVRVRRTA